MGAREGANEKHFRNELLKMKCYVRKFVSPGHRGVFDRIVGYKGHVFFVELKTIDGPVSVRQKREKIKLEENNLNCFILRSIEDVNNFVGMLKCIK